MELFENLPTTTYNYVSTAFRTLSHLVLDVGAALISPQQTACLRLKEPIGQVFGLVSC